MLSSDRRASQYLTVKNIKFTYHKTVPWWDCYVGMFNNMGCTWFCIFFSQMDIKICNLCYGFWKSIEHYDFFLFFINLYFNFKLILHSTWWLFKMLTQKWWKVEWDWYASGPKKFFFWMFEYFYRILWINWRLKNI